VVWQGHVVHRGQGERGIRAPPCRTVPAGPARGRAWNVPSRVCIVGKAAGWGSRGTTGVPRAAIAALLARAAALSCRAERARSPEPTSGLPIGDTGEAE